MNWTSRSDVQDEDGRQRTKENDSKVASGPEKYISQEAVNTNNSSALHAMEPEYVGCSSESGYSGQRRSSFTLLFYYAGKGGLGRAKGVGEKE
jgi:hypothetical protein